jgi:hypothetical protein
MATRASLLDHTCPEWCSNEVGSGADAEMTTFKIATASVILLATGIGAFWNQSQIEWVVVNIVLVMLILAHGIGKDLERVETRLCGPNDNEHDQKIDEQVSRETDGYWKHLKRLKTEKEKLPRINTWDIGTIPNWEQYLIEQAESLRGLIDTEHDIRAVPMDYNLAYALADFAHLQKDLAVKETEWAIKRIEVLGAMRQRQFSFKSIVEGEQELREIENQIAAMEERLPTSKYEIWEEFKRARDRAPAKG